MERLVVIAPARVLARQAADGHKQVFGVRYSFGKRHQEWVYCEDVQSSVAVRGIVLNRRKARSHHLLPVVFAVVRRIDRLAGFVLLPVRHVLVDRFAEHLHLFGVQEALDDSVSVVAPVLYILVADRKIVPLLRCL